MLNNIKKIFYGVNYTVHPFLLCNNIGNQLKNPQDEEIQNWYRDNKLHVIPYSYAYPSQIQC